MSAALSTLGIKAACGLGSTVLTALVGVPLQGKKLGLPSWRAELPPWLLQDEGGQPPTRGEVALTDVLVVALGVGLASLDVASHHLNYTVNNLIGCMIAADILQVGWWEGAEVPEVVGQKGRRWWWRGGGHEIARLAVRVCIRGSKSHGSHVLLFCFHHAMPGSLHTLMQPQPHAVGHSPLPPLRVTLAPPPHPPMRSWWACAASAWRRSCSWACWPTTGSGCSKAARRWGRTSCCKVGCFRV